MTDTISNFPMERRTAFDPPIEYSEGPPVRRVRLYDGRQAWLITGYDEVRSVLTDARASADRSHPSFPFASASREALERADPSFVGFDDPEHARIRRAFIRYFTVRRIAAHRPAIETIVNDLVTAMIDLDQPVDFVRHFASEVPARTICHLLGIPVEDRGLFQELDGKRNALATEPDAVRAATQEMLDLAGNLIASKRRDPGDDLVSHLVHSEAVETLTAEELLYSVRLLITASHETTSNMISLGLVALLQHPDQWQALITDTSLIPKATEELLRYVSIFHISPTRVATEPFTLAGQQIAAGDGLIPVSAAANRDPVAFPDPDRLDVRRDARPHVAFGYGIHQCLGQALGRLEMNICLEVLTRRMPTIRLAVDQDDLVVSEHSFLKLETMPISWR